MKKTTSVLKMRVNLETLSSAIEKIIDLSRSGSGSYVCVSNVHMCMEVQNSNRIGHVVNSADLVVTDGKPIFFIANLKERFLNKKANSIKYTQVRGQDLVDGLCSKLSNENYNMSVGFYGGQNDKVLDNVESSLLKLYPNLNISFKFSPPIIKQGESETSTRIDYINKSNVDILFVGLGCPKQEEWMYLHKDKLSCCMIGVGAAFDFISGNKKHAPVFIQRIWLEWLYRLLSEPKRLWKRYLLLNPAFIWLNMCSLFRYIVNKK